MRISLAEIFAQRVRALRLEKGWQQKELGEAIELSPDAISMMERAQRYTTMESMVALADVFGVSIDYLMGRTDTPEVNHSRD